MRPESNVKPSSSTSLLTALCAALLLTAGCGTPQSDSAADQLPANSAQTDALYEACLATTNLGESQCRCVSDRAGAELSEDGLAYLVALTLEDEAEGDRLSLLISTPEVVVAGMFMTNAPAACAAEGHGLRTP